MQETGGRVVIPKKKHEPINFNEFIFNKEKKKEITTLSKAQQEAIKKIENYYINRFQMMKNWKNQKHFSYKSESISCRVSKQEFNNLRIIKDISKYIKIFTRNFIWDPEFRKNFIGNLLHEQINKDGWLNGSPFKRTSDLTDYNQLLIEMYPKVIGAKIYNIEKELFAFYFTFIENKFSISYVLRCALLNYETLSQQIQEIEPFGKDEVLDIMLSFLKEVFYI